MICSTFSTDSLLKTVVQLITELLIAIASDDMGKFWDKYCKICLSNLLSSTYNSEDKNIVISKAFNEHPLTWNHSDVLSIYSLSCKLKLSDIDMCVFLFYFIVSLWFLVLTISLLFAKNFNLSRIFPAMLICSDS